MPEGLEDEFRAFARPSVESIDVAGDFGPYRMRVRALPRSSGARPTETLLAGAWQKLRLMRRPEGPVMRFAMTVPLDAVTGPWVVGSFGTEVFAEIDESEPQLEVTLEATK